MFRFTSLRRPERCSHCLFTTPTRTCTTPSESWSGVKEQNLMPSPPGGQCGKFLWTLRNNATYVCCVLLKFSDVSKGLWQKLRWFGTFRNLLGCSNWPLEARPHRRRIGIRPELSKRIGIESVAIRHSIRDDFQFISGVDTPLLSERFTWISAGGFLSSSWHPELGMWMHRMTLARGTQCNAIQQHRGTRILEHTRSVRYTGESWGTTESWLT